MPCKRVRPRDPSLCFVLDCSGLLMAIGAVPSLNREWSGGSKASSVSAVRRDFVSKSNLLFFIIKKASGDLALLGAALLHSRAFASPDFMFQRITVYGLQVLTTPSEI